VGGCAVGRGLVRGALSGEVKEARLRSGGNESTERGKPEFVSPKSVR
jgi:hypothetical protein